MYIEKKKVMSLPFCSIFTDPKVEPTVQFPRSMPSSVRLQSNLAYVLFVKTELTLLDDDDEDEAL